MGVRTVSRPRPNSRASQKIGIVARPIGEYLFGNINKGATANIDGSSKSAMREQMRFILLGKEICGQVLRRATGVLGGLLRSVAPGLRPVLRKACYRR